MKVSRRSEEEEGHENGERWLLTYADMITLLLALFIILYTMSNLDLKKFQEMAKNLGNAFNPTGMGTGNGTGGGSGNGTGTGVEIPDTKDETQAETEAAAQNPTTPVLPQVDGLEEIYTELSLYIEDNKLDSSITLEKTGSYVKVRLKDKVLFYPDKATMIEASKPILTEIGKAISKVYEKIDHITISGHTANTTNDTITSNDFAWQLSSDRAVTVLNFLSGIGLPENKLSIEGYSHFNPVAKNDTEENRAKNRRVEITITKESVDKAAKDAK
jgi:chemotaxis protein MotB